MVEIGHSMSRDELSRIESRSQKTSVFDTIFSIKNVMIRVKWGYIIVNRGYCC